MTVPMDGTPDRREMMDERAISSAGRQAGAWGMVSRLAEADGAVSHAWFRGLATGRGNQRDLADAVHGLCTLYGNHPGLADEALARHALPAAADWLAEAAAGFAAERGYLARLIAAAGPLPSTPGQAETLGAINGQAHALLMLARSDRSGCALGAVAAFVVDWAAIRRVLDAAADRFGVTAPPDQLPDAAETASLVAALGTNPAVERAIGFGAQQLLAQHRGLWSLLDARASARAG
jgi:hypothetical protein